MHAFRAAIVVLCVGCGGSGRPVRIGPAAAHPTETEQAPTTQSAPTAPVGARVRIIHAAIEARDVRVSIVADGAAASLVGPTGFQFASAYGALTAGDHTLSVRDESHELIAATLSLAEGSHTIVAFSTADFPVALAAVPDATDEAPAEMANVRLFHAIVGMGPIDLCLAPEGGRGDGHPLIAGVAPGTFGEPTGAYTGAHAGATLALQLRARDATPCHGRAIGATSFTPAAGNSYTLVAVGRTRGRRAPIELIFCADPPAADTSCATLVVTAH